MKTNQEMVGEMVDLFMTFPSLNTTARMRVVAEILGMNMLKALEAKDTEAVLAVEIATRNMQEAHQKNIIRLAKEHYQDGIDDAKSECAACKSCGE